MSARLILFDIDGTLIRPNGIGRAAIRPTLRHLVGRDTALDGLSLAGKVDWGIWRELLAREGITAAEVDARLGEISDRYIAELARVLAADDGPRPELLPGVVALLERLSGSNDVVLGLLTGNFARSASLKLEAAGLARYFRVGAYGEDAPERASLPAVAVARAARLDPGIPREGAGIVIIGDTEHDVSCGAALGVRTLGVATGARAAATLRAAGADLVVNSLAETDAIVGWLLD